MSNQCAEFENQLRAENCPLVIDTIRNVLELGIRAAGCEIVSVSFKRKFVGFKNKENFRNSHFGAMKT